MCLSSRRQRMGTRGHGILAHKCKRTKQARRNRRQRRRQKKQGRHTEGANWRPRGKHQSSRIYHAIGKRLRRPAHRHHKLLGQHAAIAVQNRIRQHRANRKVAERAPQSRHSRHSRHSKHSRHSRHSGQSKHSKPRRHTRHGRMRRAC
jgi:hypothetical protein